MLLALALALAAADPVAPTPPKDRSVEAAVQIVRDYYAAIQGHDYHKAYRLFPNGHSFAAFRRGYAQTVRVSVTPIPPYDAEGGAGSVYAEINVRVDAVLRSGIRQHFAGSYTLRRVNDVDGSTAAQRRWHIMSAHLRAVRG
jgi:hypothetical protein